MSNFSASLGVQPLADWFYRISGNKKHGEASKEKKLTGESLIKTMEEEGPHGIGLLLESIGIKELGIKDDVCMALEEEANKRGINYYMSTLSIK